MVGSDLDIAYLDKALAKAVYEPPSERMHALKIAINILDHGGRDSESHIAILSRQFIQLLDLVEKLEKDLRRWRTNEDELGNRI